MIRHRRHRTACSRKIVFASSLALCAAASLPLRAYAAPFGFDTVVDKAKALAAKPYQAPEEVPEFMRKLSYDEFRGIRFDPENSLWRDSNSRFQVMLVAAGLFFRYPVTINVIDGQGVHRLPFHKEYFKTNNADLAKRIPADLGYAGFKLTYPINERDVHDQFLVFAGASYFRGVGKDNVFGASGRGLAVNTGLMSGEEFPDFVEYWLERPSKGASSMRFYALLDSASVTGAYRFSVSPGRPTRLDVKAALFPRDDIELLGIAPLTSMFFYGENTTRPQGQWRPEVHDSDGLLIHNGTGEWLWNPLANPKELETQAFSVDHVKGFGLMQRDQRYDSYQDPEARSDRRPSLWVTPQGDWGKGRVMLIEIPSENETNDNIVAFWSPPDAVDPNQRLDFAYRVEFGDAGIAGEDAGQTLDTFVGLGNVTGGGKADGAYRVIVDFTGGALEGLDANAAVGIDVSAQQGGSAQKYFLTPVDAPVCQARQGTCATGGALRWRVSMLARPAEDKPLALRAFLKKDDKPLTETWTYTLPQANSIRGEE